MDYNQLLDNFRNLVDQFLRKSFEFFPNFVAAVLIFVLGLLFARLVRGMLNRFINKLDRLIPHRGLQERLRLLLESRPVAKVVSSVFYYMLIFFFLTAATEALGLPVVTTWLGGITGYLPRILIAILIGLTGLIGSLVLRDIIVTAAVSAGIIYGELLGRLFQGAVLLLTIIVGIEQIGVDVTLLTSLTVIVFGALLLGGSLAFALGARTSVSNILASHYLQKTHKVGDIVRIGDTKGQISRITAVALILDCPEGRVFVPAKTFNENVSVLMESEESHG
jgi:hypothetical protein